MVILNMKLTMVGHPTVDFYIIQRKPMNRRNLYAYTEPNQVIYPKFISINAEIDGTISIHVRGHHARGGFEGPQASINLSVEESLKFVTSISKLNAGSNEESI